MRKIFESKYFRIAATVFAAGAALIIFWQIVTKWGGFKDGVRSFLNILQPFAYGLVMAYLLAPIYNAVVRGLYPRVKNRFKQKDTALKFSRVIGSVVAVLLIFAIIAALIVLFVPQLIDSISGIVQTLPGRVEYINEAINRLMTRMENEEIAQDVINFTDDLEENIVKWARTTLIPAAGDFMQVISQRVMLTIRTVLNFFIGVIACIYFLNGKERFKAQARKTVRSLVSRSTASELSEFVHYTDRTFGSFINGKIIDSLIIGVLCGICMAIFRLPYPLLISTIIGITNIIPFFGPFIGAIPAMAIIFLISPWKSLYFLILIIVLQQLDGNVIGPKIIGSSMGLGSFWVMFAIIISGGMFGFLGMVLGVPVFAVIYYYLGKLVSKRLQHRGLPERTEDYMEFNHYDIDRKDVLK